MKQWWDVFLKCFLLTLTKSNLAPWKTQSQTERHRPKTTRLFWGVSLSEVCLNLSSAALDRWQHVFNFKIPCRKHILCFLDSWTSRQFFVSLSLYPKECCLCMSLFIIDSSLFRHFQSCLSNCWLCILLSVSCVVKSLYEFSCKGQSGKGDSSNTLEFFYF